MEDEGTRAGALKELRELQLREEELETKTRAAVLQLQEAIANAGYTGYEILFAVCILVLIAITIAGFLAGLVWGILALLLSLAGVVALLMYSDLLLLLSSGQKAQELQKLRERARALQDELEQCRQKLEIKRREVEEPAD